MNANAQPRETESEMHQSLHAGSYARTQKIQHMQRNTVKQIRNNLKTTKTRRAESRKQQHNKEMHVHVAFTTTKFQINNVTFCKKRFTKGVAKTPTHTPKWMKH